MTERPLYLTDLNPQTHYGLNHELYCIVDALMIGHFTGRDIMTTGFYPDYNGPVTIPLSDVLDLEETNRKLREMGILSKLHDFAPLETWTDSQYINPVFRPEFLKLPGNRRFTEMISALLNEKAAKEPRVNLWTTFVWPFMTPFDYDPLLTKISVQIFCCLTLSEKMEQGVKTRLARTIGSDQSYYVCHLRLEDDWVNHLSTVLENPHRGNSFEDISRSIFQEIVTYIENECQDKKIFIATGLGKSEQRNNFYLDKLQEMFPDRLFIDRKTYQNWGEIYPGVKFGRELEGLIDYTICQRAEKLILAWYSSFSVSLKYFCAEKGIPVRSYMG